MLDKKSREVKEVNFDSLRFMRIFTPDHIPKQLIEQIRDRSYEVDDWYKYQKVICTQNTPDGPRLNPLSLLYVVADEDNKVVGMLWCEVCVLEKMLIVQNFSMDKQYWCKGRAVEILSRKASEIVDKLDLKGVFWVTNYPKHSERHGFKRSKSVLMEYVKEKDNGEICIRELQPNRICPINGPESVECTTGVATGTGT